MNSNKSFGLLSKKDLDELVRLPISQRAAETKRRIEAATKLTKQRRDAENMAKYHNPTGARK